MSELPPLPEPVSSRIHAAWGPKPDLYTADQMRAYAIAAQQATPDWRPFGLTVEHALNRGDDPAMLFDENSPLRDELRRLLAAAPSAQQAAQPLTEAQIVDEFVRLQAHGESLVMDLHDFTAGVCYAERAHGIAAEQPKQASKMNQGEQA